MDAKINRKEFLKLVGLGGAVFASGLSGFASAGDADEAGDFFFVQLSDTHWGFTGPKVNPEAENTLREAVTAVNNLAIQPDFVVFTGDLTHTTDDEGERRRRLAKFKEIASGLKVRDVRFMPGEHDASLDAGKAYLEFFDRTHYTFEHKGVHFIAIDNVSDPHGAIGDDQLRWLRADLDARSRTQPIVVLAHRPLFGLYPQWDWDTKDGEKAIELLLPYKNVTVFYGHIHQEHHFKTEHIPHHAARSLMFPLPAPGSVPQKAPIPWDPGKPFAGLGWRDVKAEVYAKSLDLTIEEKYVRG
jgi:3',5'-cyclic AMP phosphodiesterase CpdA